MLLLPFLGSADDSSDSNLPELHIAVIDGDLNSIKQLLASGKDINQLDPLMGNSPLHIAAQTDHSHVVKFLLDNGAFINLKAPRSGFTPLMIAAWYSKESNIKTLFEYPELNINLKTSTGNMAEDMVGGWDRNIEPHEKVLYTKLRALFAEKRQELNKLVSSQKILNVIETAELKEHVKLTKIIRLLRQGEDVNQRRPVYSSPNDWHTPLLIASRQGENQIVKLLLENGADQTIPGYPMNAIAMHKAGYMGHSQVVKLLLNHDQAPLVINAQGPNNGYTPLHDAIWHGNQAAAKAFIDGGASLQLITYEKDSPIDLAKRYNYEEIIKVLSDRVQY